MWRRRIAYLLVLLCALAGQIFDTGYLFHFLFVAVAALPFLGLALSLPAMCRVRGELRASSGQIPRGENAGWTLRLENRSRLPLARISCRVQMRHSLTGAKRTLRVRDGGRSWTADTRHCGLVQCRAGRIWVCDCLGLFALPGRAPQPDVLIITPLPEDPGPIVLPSGGMSVPVPKGKAASGEDYELRPYRPGDSLRTIHWKMSAKRDDLITRELLAERRPLPVLTLDHFGSLDELDRTLDRLAGCSRALLDQERPHAVCWAHPDTGQIRRMEVDSDRAWQVCLRALLSDPCPPNGCSILDRPLVVEAGTEVYRLHFTGEEAAYAGS